MNVKKTRFLYFSIVKLMIFCLISILVLSGCEQIKELYGIEPSGEEEYVPIEEIKIEEPEEMPETSVENREIEEIIEGIEEVSQEEIVEEVPEEIIEIIEESGETPEGSGEVPAEKAKVLIVKETDSVSLRPKATDPDKDKLSFGYTSPIGADGKWQTTYGNAGEYTVTITASDGELSTTKDVLIIVNKKEEAPVIDESLPKEESLEAKENSKLDFSVKASDLNKDPLTYNWKLDGIESSQKTAYTYEISYDDAGQHTVKVVVSDGVKEASKIWALKVENVNRKPALEKIADISVKETEKIIMVPKAIDPDKEDTVKFSLDSEKLKQVDSGFEWATTYDDSGEYSVKVTASDGTDEVSQTVKITIQNVNRPPVIEDIILE